MLDELPDEIILLIIQKQILQGDYNPALFNKRYKKLYEEYIAKHTNWDKEKK